MAKKGKKTPKSASADKNACAEICGLPFVPERQLALELDPNRAALIRYIEKKWTNHTVLHYCFLDSPPVWKGRNDQKQAVRDAFQEWKDLGIGLEFLEVSEAAEAEIRIGFQPGGSWSYVGRDCLKYASDPRERTMNFGWDLTTSYGHDTALHEIGHALGFPHEHQNPNAGIQWDEEKVYAEFSGPPNNWARDKIEWNVLRKLNPAEIGGSDWDPDSIMHYRFQAGLIVQPSKYQTQDLIPADGLSEVDIEEVMSFYPPPENQLPELQVYESKQIQIRPGEQLDLVIRPTFSRTYTIQTFGSLDTVMVLFEERDGVSRYVDGDDDSGNSYNAKIESRLVVDRVYYLRIRLYYAQSQGEGALMMW